MDPHCSHYRRPGKPVFHIVGTDKPNQTRAQMRQFDLKQQHMKVMTERIQEANVPGQKRP